MKAYGNVYRTDTGSGTSPSSLSEILEAINKSNEAVADKAQQVGGISADINLIKEDLKKKLNRCGEVEKRINDIEKEMSLLKSEIKEINTEILMLKQKIKDMEDRSRK